MARKGKSFLIGPDNEIIPIDSSKWDEHYRYMMDNGLIEASEEPEFGDYEDEDEYNKVADNWWDNVHNEIYDKGYGRVRQYTPEKFIIAMGAKRALPHPDVIAELMDLTGNTEFQLERGNKHEFAGDWLDYVDFHKAAEQYSNPNSRVASLLKQLSKYGVGSGKRGIEDDEGYL